jgi:hypothetical protein
MTEKLVGLIEKIRFGQMLILMSALAMLVTIHKLWFTTGAFNNYDIFVASFRHLLQHKPLYELYPELYHDLYKYNPSFALLMAPFSVLPRSLGVLLWNLANMLLPVLALQQISLRQLERNFIVLFISVEMITSIQNAQSNGLMFGMMLMAFAAFEKKKVNQTGFWISLGFFVKIFAAAPVLFLAMQKKLAHWLIALTAFGLLFLLLPLPFTGFTYLQSQYFAWFELLRTDSPHALNYSLMSFSERALGLQLPHSFYLAFGFISLLLPLFRRKMFQSITWRTTYLALILVWVVIFNHKAESPTFVIAMGGAALWFAVSNKLLYQKVLIVITFIITGLSATDIFPILVKENFFKPYAIKVLPCIVLYGVMLAELCLNSFEMTDKQNNKALNA